MKPTLLFCHATILLALLAVPAAYAGTIDSQLQERLALLGPTDPVAVIVRLADTIDPRAFRSPNKALRRAALIRALKGKADASQKALKNFLATDAAVKPASIVVLWNINAVAVTIPARLVQVLSRRTDVKRIGLDAEVTLSVQQAQPTAQASIPEWNIDLIHAPDLWALGVDGTDVVVAVMDTGVDANHPDIGPSYRGGTNSWFDPNGEHAQPYDINGHGTATMGIITGGGSYGTDIGVAPGAQWIAAKIFNDDDVASLSAIHDAFQWVLDPDGNPDVDDAPDIVNNSWVLDGTVNQCISEFDDDILALKSAGIAVVFAAGNTGPEGGTSLSPSNSSLVTSVGAVGQTGETQYVAGFSARGPSACDGGIFPRMVAPGVDIYTADLTLGGAFPNAYQLRNGTSFAAPHVSGAMALLKSAFGAASVSLLESAIVESASDLAPSGPDNDSGAGLLDALAAYEWMLANAAEASAGQLKFRNAAYSAGEKNGSIIVSVNRTRGTVGEVTVDYATTDGTARAGDDYEAAAGTLIFPDGVTSQTFTINLVDDVIAEADEDLTLSLTNPGGGAVLGIPDSAVLTITDKDTGGCLEAARIAGPLPFYFTTAQAAYDASQDGDTIQMRADVSPGGLSLEQPRTAALEGGYDCNYEPIDQNTTIAGSLTISNGTAVLARIAIGPP